MLKGNLYLKCDWLFSSHLAMRKKKSKIIF